MRELKFRVWDSDENEMLYPSDGYWYVGRGTGVIQVLKDVKTTAGMIVTELGPMINGEIMQHTGLCDKNGVEIYEGDLLRFPKYQQKSVVAEVAGMTPYGLSLVYRTGYRGGGFWHREIRRDEATVIGNIYEHPELLEDAK